jgi:hypothetical protein
LQQYERDQRVQVSPLSQVPVLVIAAACRGVDQVAEPGDGVVDELTEPGFVGQCVPFANP